MCQIFLQNVKQILQFSPFDAIDRRKSKQILLKSEAISYILRIYQEMGDDSMQNITIDFRLSIDQIIDLIGVLVAIITAVVSGVYVVVTNTQKFELTENYRKELLDWYSETSGLMIDIIHHIESGAFFDKDFRDEKTNLLSRLFAKVELGRFYCPNVIKGDGFGKRKPSAYQGYRHITREFLQHFYNIASEAESSDCVTSLWEMEKHYTSMIFNMIKPSVRNKRYSKYTEIAIPEGQSIEDFIRENPDKISMFDYVYIEP